MNAKKAIEELQAIKTYYFSQRKEKPFFEPMLHSEAKAIDMAIEALKSARPTGEWIEDELGTVVCSECRRSRRDNRVKHIHFCNSCGAEMEGDDE